jgi:hypothetical protein
MLRYHRSTSRPFLLYLSLTTHRVPILHVTLPPQRFLRQTPSWEHVQLSTYGSSSSGLGVGAQSDIDMTLSLPAIRGAKQKAEVCGAGRKGLNSRIIVF